MQERDLRRQGNEVGQKDGIEELLHRALAEALVEGHYSLSEVARRMYVSPRSLQRYLSARGTTFSKETRVIRLRLAADYMRKEGLSTDEISLLVGYRDPVSFRHAFRQWTGVNVGEYRRSLQLNV